MTCEDSKTFHDKLEKAHKAIADKYADLHEKDLDQYLVKVTEENARFIFSYLDQDSNQMLDKSELVNMAKLTVSNDTETAETFAEVTLHSDKNGDKMLVFDEFYQPKIEHGPTDTRHQHKDGHGHDAKPRRHVEL